MCHRQKPTFLASIHERAPEKVTIITKLLVLTAFFVHLAFTVRPISIDSRSSGVNIDLIHEIMDLHSKNRQFSGQLYKYTNVMKGWQYRYFTVDGSAGLLHYYLCEGEKPEGTLPRGSVHLAGAVICPSDEDSKTFTVNCASGDMLKLRAADARARQEWVNGLRAVAESHTKAISATSPPLPPREHLAVLDAMGTAKAQLQNTEQADIALCRVLESAGSTFIDDPNLLLLKATSAASLHCLLQCYNILQRNQHQPARTGLVIDDD